MRRYPTFGQGFAITAVINIVLSAIGLITGVLAARLLGPAGRGELGAIQTWPNLIATIAMLGMPEALVYFCARYPEGAASYLASAIALAFLLCAPFMICAYFALPWLLSAQTEHIVNIARLYLTIIPLYGLLGMIFHPLRGRNDLYAWNFLRLSPSVGWCVVLLAAWLSGRGNPGFLAKSNLVLLAILCLPALLIVYFRVPGRFSPNPRLWMPMLRFGLPSIASSAPQMLNLRLDQMLMAGLLPARILGLYVVAVAWSGSVAPMINALGAVLFPRVASAATKAERARTFASGTRLTVLLIFVLCITITLITPLAVPILFGNGYRSAIPSAVILVVGAGLLGLNLVIAEGMRGWGQPMPIFWAELGGLVITIVFLLLLLKPFGIIGAAIASVAAYSTVTLLLVLQAVKITGVSTATFLRPRRDEIAVLANQIRKFIYPDRTLKFGSIPNPVYDKKGSDDKA